MCESVIFITINEPVMQEYQVCTHFLLLYKNNYLMNKIKNE